MADSSLLISAVRSGSAAGPMLVNEPPGTIYLAVKRLPPLADVPVPCHLFVAIDSASCWVCVGLARNSTPEAAEGFVMHLLRVAPFRITTLIIGAGAPFVSSGAQGGRGIEQFADTCLRLGLHGQVVGEEARPPHGRIEQLNRRLEQVLVRQLERPFAAVETSLEHYARLHNESLPQKVALPATPSEILQQWWLVSPQLFTRRPGRLASIGGHLPQQLITSTSAAPAQPAATLHAATTVRTAVLQLLRSFGMTTIFGNPGSTELPLTRDFPADFRYVLGLQEAVVVGMADGYAQATRRAAFVNLHSAAGVGNAMGNIFTAYMNRTPLVLTAGQQARSMLPFDPFLYSAQATELPKPYVKWSIEPARAQDVPLALARAYYIAMQPPCGPVLVSIPADDWERPAEVVEPRIVSSAIRPEPGVLEQIGNALDASRRPAFVVGAGVDRDGAWDEVRRLAERHRARVWVAPLSGRCSFAENHPLFAGFLSSMREKLVGQLGGHDFILAIGAAAFSYHVEGSGPHLPDGASLCQLIDDPQTAAWTPVGMSAVCSIRLGVQDLLARAAPATPRELPPRRPRSPRAEPPVAGERMSVAFALQTLHEVRDQDDIVVAEAPSSHRVMQDYLPITRSETYYTAASGGLGFGLPAAVGIALGKPGARVINVMGDGSSMYSIQALWNVAQLKLPITIVILKNRRYAALQDFASVFGYAPGEKPQGSDLPELDFVALARGQGCEAVHVERAADLRDVLTQALRSTGPVLVEIEVQ